MNSNWSKLHNFYKDQDWINQPNIFAKEVIKYFPRGSYIIELGAGQGQDTRFFVQEGFKVMSTDIADLALEESKSKILPQLKDLVRFEKLDLAKEFPFKKNEFEVVYAHLSLHYFDKKITHQIFSEIYRVLKKGGIVAALFNSISDPEYKQGKELETDLFRIDGVDKRYFSISSLKPYVKEFETILLDNLGKTYKDEAKGVGNLIRYVGQKL